MGECDLVGVMGAVGQVTLVIVASIVALTILLSYSSYPGDVRMVLLHFLC